jgi:hypothetical protein
MLKLANGQYIVSGLPQCAHDREIAILVREKQHPA